MPASIAARRGQTWTTPAARHRDRSPGYGWLRGPREVLGPPTPRAAARSRRTTTVARSTTGGRPRVPRRGDRIDAPTVLPEGGAGRLRGGQPLRAGVQAARGPGGRPGDRAAGGRRRRRRLRWRDAPLPLHGPDHRDGR